VLVGASAVLLFAGPAFLWAMETGQPQLVQVLLRPLLGALSVAAVAAVGLLCRPGEASLPEKRSRAKRKGPSMAQQETPFIGISDAARRLGLPARAISDAVYRGKIDVTGWPLVAGRRLVPVSELAAIKKLLVK
jgi:hypothetical protein